jgi:hypothetical protein
VTASGRGDRAHPLDAPFRPRLARVVCLTFATVVAVLTPALAIMLPATGVNGLALPDRLGIGGVGAAVVWFLWRQAAVRAVPDDAGLTVRNLMLSRRLAWAEIVSVQFGSGRPWVQLDLADGDTLAVMGIQQADGAFGALEAGRLATLVALHSRVDRDD